MTTHSSESPNPLARAELYQAAMNPDLAAQYLRSQRDVAAGHSRIRRLENELRAERIRRQAVEKELGEAVKRRNRLQHLLDKQTERVEKFKGAYEELRSVPHIRTAAAVLQPGRTMRRLARKLSPAAENGTRPEALDAPASVREDSVEGDPAASSVDGRELGARSAFQEAMLQARQDFFTGGLIAKPYTELRAAFALAPADSRKNLSEKDRQFVDQLRGLAALLERAPAPGPRQPGPGYLPVLGRIMYCAHSTGKFNSNGYSTRTAGLVRAMAEAGSDVFVAARPGYPWDAKTSVPTPLRRRFEQQIDGVRHVFNPGPNWSSGPVDIFIREAADAFVREALINRPAVIHSASNYVTALPAALAARRLGIPFVYEVRGFWEISEAAAKPDGWLDSERFGLVRAMETLVARLADRVLAITAQVREELIRRGVDAARIEIVPNAADPAEFVPVSPDKDLRGRLNLESDNFVIGYAGSLVAYEGLETLISAHAELINRHPGARLVVVGDGPELARLRKQANDAGIAASVTFTGRVAAKDIPRYLSTFDAVVCPRTRSMVTEMVSPIKPLEAMASGRALVVSDVAPLVDLVGEDERHGLVFRAGDAGHLAMCLARLAVEPGLISDLGRAARAWVSKHRSWTAVAELVRAAHAALERGDGIAKPQSRLLVNQRVGIIADEFTTKSLEGECVLVPLDPDTWLQQLESEELDVVLVESAWEGNGGRWHRKVGFYGEDEFSTLRDLAAHCRTKGIPTIFWNKEDPVHIQRFLPTASHFDHVFTTDATCIPRYAAARGAAGTVHSLPFFAQPRLHRPLPTDRKYSHTVAYGGSYYGDRYAKRSKELATILEGADAHGLTIYDRQVNHPDSPYRFPDHLAGYVQGGLPYSEMVKAYKSHPVHVNVNSVDASPTMFSRRVMEVAASGTPVLTGPGDGVTTFFGARLPVITRHADARVLAAYWMGNEAARNQDAWELHRTVYRSHLAAHRLGFMLRTAGLLVELPELPSYSLHVDLLDEDVARAILAQTHRPEVVLCSTRRAEAAEILEAANIRVLEKRHTHDGRRQAWLGEGIYDPNLAEDLARSFGLAGQTTEVQVHDLAEPGHTLLEPRAARGGAPWFGQLPKAGETVCAVRRAIVPVRSRPAGTNAVQVVRERHKTVLVAGHDLKFARGIINHLQGTGQTVLVDQWQDHSHHDPEQSLRLLQRADAVFCEWSLGNSVWYARHKKPNQRLTVRFHSQELFTPHPSNLDLTRVDQTVFVGELVRSMAIRRFGHPAHKTCVVPNAVADSLFERSPSPDARFNLGMVGIVPAQKHLDRALDVLAALREEDTRYRLFIKGKTPEDYPWMLRRADEMAFYNVQRARISEDPRLNGAVQFDGHGDDMAQWYKNIGVVLSVSDFESFHLTLADGAAGGAMPASLAWPGAEHIYPGDWLHLTTAAMAEHVLASTSKERVWRERGQTASDYVRRHFHEEQVFNRLAKVILGGAV